MLDLLKLKFTFFSLAEHETYKPKDKRRRKKEKPEVVICVHRWISTNVSTTISVPLQYRRVRVLTWTTHLCYSKYESTIRINIQPSLTRVAPTGTSWVDVRQLQRQYPSTSDPSCYLSSYFSRSFSFSLFHRFVTLRSRLSRCWEHPPAPARSRDCSMQKSERESASRKPRDAWRMPYLVTSCFAFRGATL